LIIKQDLFDTHLISSDDDDDCHKSFVAVCIIVYPFCRRTHYTLSIY